MKHNPTNTSHEISKLNVSMGISADQPATCHANLPPALAQIAAGRDHINTSEFARSISRANQTLRKLLCQQGHAFGIRPIKFGGRLLWPVAEIAGLFSGAAA